MKTKTVTFALIAAALAGVLAAPALAQRDPAYAAARAAGTVGERVNGYLGIVGAPTPELQRMVDDLNNQRREVYARRGDDGAICPHRRVPGDCPHNAG